MTSPAAKTLLLAPACTGVRVPVGTAYWSWARAQSARYPLLLRFRRFVCFPAAFPRRSATIDHCREGMAKALAGAVNDGGLAVFLVPSWRPGRDGIDDAWNRSAWVIQAVTGVRVRPLLRGTGLRVTPAPQCPPAITGLLEKAHATYELHVPGDEFGSALMHHVVGGIESPTGAPCAMAGYPGEGAWLILPSDAQAHDVGACGLAVGLVDVLNRMRDQARGLPAGGSPSSPRRPRPGTDLDDVLRFLEAAPKGNFIVLRDRRAVSRLKTKYAVQIESVADARQRGVKVPSNAKGYRLVPRAEG